MNDWRALTLNVEAHYSPDDGGWYLQDYQENKIGLPQRGDKTTAERSSGVWVSKAAAQNAFLEDKVDWA